MFASSSSSSGGLNGRQNIGMRPAIPPPRANQGNADKEFQAEQARLEAKKRQLQRLEEERRKSIFPTGKEEKLEIQQKHRQEIAQHLQVKQSLQTREESREFKSKLDSQQMGFFNTRVEQEHAAAKREYLRNVMEENKRLMEYRKQQQVETKQREIQQERASQGRDAFDLYQRSTR